jgi:hypothetical protein
MPWGGPPLINMQHTKHTRPPPRSRPRSSRPSPGSRRWCWTGRRWRTWRSSRTATTAPPRVRTRIMPSCPPSPPISPTPPHTHTGSLWEHLNRCQTAFGARKLRDMLCRPSQSPATINARCASLLDCCADKSTHASMWRATHNPTIPLTKPTNHQPTVTPPPPPHTQIASTPWRS